MRLDHSASGPSPPLRILAVGLTMTVALLVLGATLAWRLYSRGQQLVTTDLRLRSITGEIMRLDELLTMSAHMAAATGDPSWERRYRQHEPVIEAYIAEAKMLAPEDVARAIVVAEGAATELVETEHRALELVRAGRGADAAALMAGGAYAEFKRQYRAAVDGITRVISDRGDRLFAEQRLHMRVVVAASLAIIAILVVAWLNIIKRLLTQRGMRAAQLALAAANRELDARVKERTAELSETNQRLEQTVEKLAATQRELMGASRKAGMAVVASGVLHNVGNVLNSVNVSCATAADVVRRIKLDGLELASNLLRSGDEQKARRVPEYLDKVAAHLADEHRHVVEELASLQKHIDHIKVVIAKQQANARAMAVHELFDVAELVEDALQFESGGDAREGIQVALELADLPIVLADRHKLTQMVVNLLANARHAVRNHEGSDKRIVVRTRALPEERFAIEVEDTGYGISPDNLAKIFEHGFTTKKDGHGFGLHAAACDVQAMGGTLRVHSGGVGRGARFTIELPRTPAPAPRDERPHSRSAAVPSILSTSVA